MLSQYQELLLKIRRIAHEAAISSEPDPRLAASIVELIDEQIQREHSEGSGAASSTGHLMMYADEPSLLRLDGQYFSIETIRGSLKASGHGVTTDNLGIHWLAHDLVKGLVDLAQSPRQGDSKVDKETFLLLAAAERITRLERVKETRVQKA